MSGLEEQRERGERDNWTEWDFYVESVLQEVESFQCEECGGKRFVHKYAELRIKIVDDNYVLFFK